MMSDYALWMEELDALALARTGQKASDYPIGEDQLVDWFLTGHEPAEALPMILDHYIEHQRRRDINEGKPHDLSPKRRGRMRRQ